MAEIKTNPFIPVLMIVASVVYAIGVVYECGDAFHLDRFVATTGTLESTDVVSSHNKTGWHFEPTMRYRYVVAGLEHHGDRIWLNSVSTRSDASAREITAKMTAIPPLTVWYDPHHPDRAVLSKARRWGKLVCPLTASALVILFSTAVLFLLRSITRRAPSDLATSSPTRDGASGALGL